MLDTYGVQEVRYSKSFGASVKVSLKMAER